MEVELEADPEFLGALATGFHLTAYSLLIELARVKGNGPWFEEMRASIRYAAAISDPPDGTPDEVASRWGDAAMAAVDHIFDSVTFEKKPKR